MKTMAGVTKFFYVIFYGFNGIIMMGGLAAAVIGVLGLPKCEMLDFLFDTKICTDTCFMLASCAFTVIAISVLGIFSAKCNKTCLLLQYSIWMLVAALLAGFSTIIVFPYLKRTPGTQGDWESVYKHMNSYFVKAKEKESNEWQNWNNVQTEFCCCGIAGKQDWLEEEIPESCRKLHMKENLIFCHHNHEDQSLYNDGCFTEMTVFLMKGASLYFYSGLGTTFAMILAFCISCYMRLKN